MILALLAFSFMPTGHAPRPHEDATPPEKPYYLAEMRRVVALDTMGFNPSETATPVLDEAQTRMYVSTHDGYVRCRFRGKDAWIFKLNGSVLAAPVIDGETLFVAGGDGVVYSLNRFTGEVRWQVDLNEELTTSPTVSGGRVFVMSSAQSITVLDEKDGKRLWKYHRDSPGGFTIRGDAQPRVAGGVVYAGFADGTVAALGTDDGVARWTRQVSGVGDYLDVDSIDAPEGDSRVYVASAKVGVLALDAANGDTVWSFNLLGANHVLVDGSRVICGGRGGLFALARTTGAQLWKMTLSHDRYPTQPVAMQGMLLVAADRGALLIVDEETGEPRGAFDPGSGFSMPVLAVPGAAFAVSNGGALYSLGLLP
jgi:outer membrane protein assembly factor BamB